MKSPLHAPSPIGHADQKPPPRSFGSNVRRIISAFTGPGGHATDQPRMYPFTSVPKLIAKQSSGSRAHRQRKTARAAGDRRGLACYTNYMLRFSKMNGAGNDFVLLDNRAGDLQLTPEQIAQVCDRHRGIGADGVLLLEPAANGADFRMRYYNSDGGEAEMCGNGARCFARFANRIAGPLTNVTFETPAGVIGATIEGERVRLQMSDPVDLRLNIDVPLASETLLVHFINSGVPHVVIPVSDLENADVQAVGSAVRHHALFAPKGANVNFLQRRAERQIAIRTYERGVEAETLACGTGVVASALIFAATEKVGGPIAVLVRGGDELSVDFARRGDQFENVTLTGPADFVFDGEMQL
jgi:diaminopimelate epimerase